MWWAKFSYTGEGPLMGLSECSNKPLGSIKSAVSRSAE